MADLRSTTHLNQLTSTTGAVHSTTSPEGSPTTTTAATALLSNNRATGMLSPLTAATNSEIDNNNVIDTGFDSDSISVTDSPRRTSSGHEDEDGRSSTPPIAHSGSVSGSGCNGSGGAFTSLIQRHNSGVSKCDLFPGFATNFAAAAPAHFNPALAAQLFLQNPLLPQPRHWLYSQLYNNYNELPWFRNINASNAVATGAAESPPAAAPTATVINDTTSNTNLIKKCVTLITHNANSGPQSVSSNRKSVSPAAPVSSTRRSISPLETIDLDDVGTTSKSPTHSNGSGSGSRSDSVSVSGNFCGPLRRSYTPKMATDVWRPY